MLTSKEWREAITTAISAGIAGGLVLWVIVVLAYVGVEHQREARIERIVEDCYARASSVAEVELCDHKARVLRGGEVNE